MQINPTEHVLSFGEIDRTRIASVGGKGAQLGELSRIDGISVPDGFCVTTEAFRRLMRDAVAIDDQLDQLSRLRPDEHGSIRTISAQIRRTLEGTPMPADVAAAIMGALTRSGEQMAYAVRSSATAEDLPTASFAGQQDTYLNVVGTASVLEHVRRCWASLFTERAVTYRMRNGFDHRRVQMAVVVQEMAFADAAGVLFTADPVTSNRKVVAIEATFGLGEALVSGLVDADAYSVRDGAIVTRTVAAKRVAIQPVPDGGTQQQATPPARQEQPALTDAQVLRLEQLGRQLEAHFGCPQDVEWCLVGDEIWVVQSRPITTLFPIPDVRDGENHVYVSVGHQQMMTDAMTPLGLSVWQLTALRPMETAGGRLFVDITPNLASPASRSALLDMLGRSDPLIRDALETVLQRRDFIRSSPDGPEDGPTMPLPAGATPAPIAGDPAIVTGLVERTRSSIAAMQREIATMSGEALLDFIVADLAELRRLLFDPISHQAIMAGMEAAWWLNDRLHEWLGETNAADALTQSVPDNVTSEMGLGLLDVADVIRPHPDVVAFLHDVDHEGFLDELPKLNGGQAARDAIVAFLDAYGMRCVGEIDITRPRWSEQPSALLPVILANVKHSEPGARERRFEQGRREAEAKAHELLERLRALPDGAQKAAETKTMIDRVRTFAGYREFPKYGMVTRYSTYKQALLREAEQLVQVGVLGAVDDIFFLTVEELREVISTCRVDRQLVRRRREEFASFQTLMPPRVLTSEGEVLSGSYRRTDLAEGALIGLAVSAGVVEGRARVLLDIADADLEPGDIVVTRYTDPSWSPLFVGISGLVTEVGGLMTHGAVIAREYGLPAVVGVEHATRLIEDGQWIRIDGTHGSVELLGDRSPTSSTAP